jgi:Ca2+-binding RTX toxin-like protein
VKGFENLSGGEITLLDDAITATDASLSLTGIENTALPHYFGYQTAGPDDDTLYGTTGADNINGGDGNDTLYAGSGGDTLHGGDGNDTLYGGSGDGTLDPGTGGNFVYGGAGNDTYVYGGGDDVYDEYSGGGTDTITLPSGITSGDLTFTGLADGSDNLALLITVGDLGTIEITNFAYTSVLSGIETLTFHDTSTLDLSDFTALTINGSSGDDNIFSIYTSQYVDETIHAGGGNDFINLSGSNSANTIDGGAGNDTIYGGSGDDTYIAFARLRLHQRQRRFRHDPHAYRHHGGRRAFAAPLGRIQ